MASFKVSQFTGVTDTTADSLLMLSYTADNGSTYSTRKIRVEDLLNDIAQDSDVSALVTLTGVAAGETDLGDFTGDTIASGSTIKEALQALETVLELKQDALTAGNGIELVGETGSEIRFKLAEGGDGSIVVNGYTSPQTFFEGTYFKMEGFSATISGAQGTASRTFAADSAFNVYRENFGSGVLAYNTTIGGWEIAYTPSGFTGTDGETFQVSTSAIDNPTIASITVDGKNSPNADSWAEGTYSAGQTSYLEFDGNGGLAVKVLDEDTLASNSDQHLPTQQSVKSYVDTQITALGVIGVEDYLRKDGTTPFEGDQSMGGFKLTNLGTPTQDSDAATKQYVDLAVQGLDLKASTKVATTGDITLSGAQTIDGVSVVAGDRVLVKDQTDASENGIYVAAAGAWARAADADGNPDGEVTSGMFTFVEQGTIGGQHGFVLSTADPIVVGTTDLEFVQFSGAGQITAGTGIVLNGNEISVDPAVLQDISDLATLSGVAENSTDLGLFTGTTIADNSTIKGALQSLETKAEQTASASANNSTTLVDHETRISANETAITSLQTANGAATTDISEILQTLGTVDGDTDLGTFTGATISDAADVKTALQELETALETIGQQAGDNTAVVANAAEITALRQAQGTANGDVNLGTFSGGIISDNVSVKTALGELEAGQAANDTELADHETRISAVETSLSSGSFVSEGDNVNELVASTVAQTEPANYLFMVVDQADGSIKVLDKTFIETEESA